MRILHWNIHGWLDESHVDNVDRIIDVLRGAKPDVISLVEVDEPWGNPVKLRKVADALGYHWVFVPAFEYREAGGFGNALLANRPFTALQCRAALRWSWVHPRCRGGVPQVTART